MGISVKEIRKLIKGSNDYMEWCAIRHPIEGEDICGDDFLIIQKEKGILIAVVDGLGHGQQALEASRRAIQHLKHYKNESLISLMNYCHEQLKNTRGVVMSLATIDVNENVMSWMGVGNVEGVLFRNSDNEETSRETILLRGGVVGYKLPLLKASIMVIEPGDTLIFTTDGVRYGYSIDLDTSQPIDEITRYISHNFVENNDDAQILVARYKSG